MHALVGAIGEHAVVGGDAGVLGDLGVEVSVRRVSPQALTVDVRLDGFSQVRRRLDRPFLREKVR